MVFLISKLKIIPFQWRIYIVKFWTRPPSPGGPNSFNFMQFLGNFDKIVCWCPPGELAPPPRGNPGSATAFKVNFLAFQLLSNSNHNSSFKLFLLLGSFFNFYIGYHLKEEALEVDLAG